MPSGRSVNAFTNSFMQGFSFVDQIRRNKKADQRLDARLREEKQDRILQRKRLALSDRRNDTLFDQSQADRSDRLADQTLADEGDAFIQQNPTATPAQLARFGNNSPLVNEHLARLSQEGRDATKDAQRRSDFELIHGRGFQEQIDPLTQDGATPQQGAAAQTQAGPIGFEEGFRSPPDEFATRRRQTNDELNLLSFRDPEQAIRIRDEQRTEDEQKRAIQADANEARRGIFSKDPSHGPTDASKKDEKRLSQRSLIQNEWRAINDINDPAGDVMRAIPASQLTEKYWNDRSNLDTVDRNNADARMRPYITTTIEEQLQIQMTAEPGSQEHRAATRKIKRAYGLAMDIGGEFSAITRAGVEKGLPLNRNAELTENVLEASHEGPGTPLPRNPDQKRIDNTLVNRPNKGRRLSKAKADASYRLWKDGDISTESYTSILNTGDLPSGITTSVEQRDPEKDTVLVFKDAKGNFLSEIITTPGRHNGTDIRNTLKGDALAWVLTNASNYNIPDYPTRGTDLANGFADVLNQNEAQARVRGYAYDNVTDIAALWKRYTNTYFLRDAYNAEWRYDGEWDPEFSQNIGTLAEALFSDKVDAAFASGEFEDARGGNFADATPLKDFGLTDAQFAEIEAQNIPELEGATREEIQAAFDLQQAER